jgi:hypothetical protein
VHARIAKLNKLIREINSGHPEIYCTLCYGKMGLGVGGDARLRTLNHASTVDSTMASTLGVPVKLLHEAMGHIITVELKTGQLYRGKLLEGWNGIVDSSA